MGEWTEHGFIHKMYSSHVHHTPLENILDSPMGNAVNLNIGFLVLLLTCLEPNNPECKLYTTDYFTVAIHRIGWYLENVNVAVTLWGFIDVRQLSET